MCSRWAVLIIGCAIAASAGAQSGPLDAHRDAVAASYARLEAVHAGAREDSARTASLPLVRKYAGMDVHADTTAIPRAFITTLDDAFNGMLRDALALLGPSAHALLTGMRLTITRGTTGEEFGERYRSPYVTLRTDPFGRRGFSYQTGDAADPNYDVLRNLFFNWFGYAAINGLSPAIRNWAGPILPVDPAPGTDRQTYTRIARTDAKSARACLEGVVRACRSLLAIEQNNDTTGSWLDAAERRAVLVRLKSERYGLSRYFFTAAGMELYNRCTAQGDDLACRDAIRVMRTSSPVGAEGRAALIRLAIQLGGTDAYSRMQGVRTTDIAASLETAAGMPVDSLLERWREQIIAARTESPLPNTHELTTSLVLCAMALVACAGRRP